MRRIIILAAALLVPATAHAEEDGVGVRAHVGAGAAHAIGGVQSSELGVGGGGKLAAELVLSRVVGVQIGAGAVALSKGDPPADEGVAQRSTGVGFLGTLGARIHPFGTSGVWVDAGGGIARTGDATRPVFDAHVGYAFAFGENQQWDIGPFIGYTHIVQPDGALRGDDARIAWVGVEIGFGTATHRAPAPPPPAEPSPPPMASPPAEIASAPAPEDRDGDVEVFDEFTENGVTLLSDRILLEDRVHFEFASARVRSKSHWMLFKLAKFINAHPEVIEVSVEGHTDAVGGEDYNEELSNERAESVRKMLVRFGVDPSRATTAGYGKRQLRVQTLAADERNRRVEFWVKRGGK